MLVVLYEAIFISHDSQLQSRRRPGVLHRSLVFILLYKLNQEKSTNINHRNNPQYLNGFKAITLMVKVVEAINTIAVVTKFSVCKAVTISERLKQI